MRHLKDIFPDKDLSVYDEDFDKYIERRNAYRKSGSEDDYLAWTSAYTAIDVDLRILLNYGIITREELGCIWDKMNEVDA